MASFIAISSQLNPVGDLNYEPVLAPPKTEVQTIERLIETRAEAAGVDAALAIKIAFCESSLRQFDKNGVPLRGLHNPDDVGLFQINEHFHLAKSEKLGFDIETTEGNIGYAMWLLANEGARHWKWSQPCWSKS